MAKASKNFSPRGPEGEGGVPPEEDFAALFAESTRLKGIEHKDTSVRAEVQAAPGEATYYAPRVSSKAEAYKSGSMLLKHGLEELAFPRFFAVFQTEAAKPTNRYHAAKNLLNISISKFEEEKTKEQKLKWGEMATDWFEVVEKPEWRRISPKGQPLIILRYAAFTLSYEPLIEDPQEKKKLLEEAYSGLQGWGDFFHSGEVPAYKVHDFYRTTRLLALKLGELEGGSSGEKNWHEVVQRAEEELSAYGVPFERPGSAIPAEPEEEIPDADALNKHYLLLQTAKAALAQKKTKLAADMFKKAADQSIILSGSDSGQDRVQWFYNAQEELNNSVKFGRQVRMHKHAALGLEKLAWLDEVRSVELGLPQEEWLNKAYSATMRAAELWVLNESQTRAENATQRAIDIQEKIISLRYSAPNS